MWTDVNGLEIRSQLTELVVKVINNRYLLCMKAVSFVSQRCLKQCNFRFPMHVLFVLRCHYTPYISQSVAPRHIKSGRHHRTNQRSRSQAKHISPNGNFPTETCLNLENLELGQHWMPALLNSTFWLANFSEQYSAQSRKTKTKCNKNIQIDRLRENIFQINDF